MAKGRFGIGGGQVMQLNTYQKEQKDALQQSRDALSQLSAAAINQLKKEMHAYLEFRDEVDRYLDEHLSSYCTQACFNSRTSACCSKDGIIIFWADVVINACNSTTNDLDNLAAAIERPQHDNKCIFLGLKGCLWRVRPLVCAMFLCDQAQTAVTAKEPELGNKWEQYRKKAKNFRWPDRPVLFDRLETQFMALGCQSALMYINSSPGLMQVKRKAGLIDSASKNKGRKQLKSAATE